MRMTGWMTSLPILVCCFIAALLVLQYSGMTFLLSPGYSPVMHLRFVFSRYIPRGILRSYKYKCRSVLLSILYH